jgi:DedD protein
LLYHGVVENRYASMETSMKQRLLGAVVLIALAIIFVPMFLSGPRQEPASETVDLRIPPPPDSELQTRVLPVDPVAPQAVRDSSAPAVAEPGSASAPVAPTPGEIAEKPAETQPAANEPVVADVPAKPPETPTPAPAAKPLPPGTAANGRYLVHLGVYAKAGNASDLVADLERGGFPAFAEATEIDGKAAQRVRVGPYADKAGAEAARLRIKRLKPDVPGSVVTASGNATADAPASALPAGRAGGWAVQLAAFSTEADANLLRDRLRNAGFAAFTDDVTSDGKTLWRVRAGPETERSGAERLRAAIKEKLKIEGVIVTR